MLLKGLLGYRLQIGRGLLDGGDNRCRITAAPQYVLYLRHIAVRYLNMLESAVLATAVLFRPHRWPLVRPSVRLVSTVGVRTM